MAKRVLLFAVWMAVGAAVSLALIYLFTALGVLLLLSATLVAWFFEGRGWGRAPEIWGLLAGPGLFLLLVGDAWVATGCALFGASLLGFFWSGRARCRRAAGPL